MSKSEQLLQRRLRVGRSYSHPLSFAEYFTVEKAHEISACRSTLQETFDTPVTSFAYPFGIFDYEDVDLVREAGFTNAVTTNEGIDDVDQSAVDPWRLRRIKVSGKDNWPQDSHGHRFSRYL